MQIRRAQPDEWAEVRQLRLRALREEPLAFGSTLEREVVLDEANWRARISAAATFLAALDDVVVGMVTGVADRDLMHLYGLYVVPSARGSGAADRLVDAILGHARELGAVRVELQVVETNAPARRLYARHGFLATGQRVRLAHTPSAIELVLVLDLSTDDSEERGIVGPAV